MGVRQTVQGYGSVTGPPIGLWNSAQFTSSCPLPDQLQEELRVTLKSLKTSFINCCLNNVTSFTSSLFC